MFKRIARFFSPKAKFVAKHKALGMPPDQIEMLWSFHEISRKVGVLERRLYEAENPPPLPQTELASHNVDWFGHHRNLAEYEAKYQEHLEEEEARRREKDAEQPAK